MFGNKLKDDTTHINELESLLKDRIKGRIVKHEVTALTAFGANYGSEMLKVDVTVDENGIERTIHAVGKLVPPTDMQHEIFNTQVSFKNEIGFYAEIVPALQAFQKENGIFPIANYFPELYGARISLNPASTNVDFDAVILMENLKVAGYDNLDRTVGFDLDTTKTILKYLANFQATVVALREKKPDVFNSKFMPYLVEWKASVPLGQELEAIVAENPKTAPFVSKVRKLVNKKRIKKIREPWATIAHNDLWVNNIMIKESSKGIESVKFVDFQIPDYGSPATDVIFLLFSSVQESVLNYHFDKLLQFYYREFIEVLKSYKIDTKEFTYESFQEELALEGSYQTFHSLFMVFPIHGPKEMTKMPGRLDAKFENSNNAPNGQPPNGPPFQLKITQTQKERVCFIVEQAAKRNWI